MGADFEAHMKVARDAFGMRDDETVEALAADRQERADNLRNFVCIGAVAAFGAFMVAVLASIAPLTVMATTFALTVVLGAAARFADFTKLVR